MQHVLEDVCGLILLIFGSQCWPSRAGVIAVPFAGMKTLCVAANYAAGMWQRWASSACRTADGETSLGSASRLTVWARGLLVSVLAADWSGCLLVRLWWTGEVTNVQPPRLSSCVHKREFHICASHLNIYFIYVHWTLCGNNLIQVKTMRIIWWTVLLIQLHSQTKYDIQWGTRARNHVFGTIKGIYSFKLSEKDSRFFLQSKNITYMSYSITRSMWEHLFYFNSYQISLFLADLLYCQS